MNAAPPLRLAEVSSALQFNYPPEPSRQSPKRELATTRPQPTGAALSSGQPSAYVRFRLYRKPALIWVLRADDVASRAIAFGRSRGQVFAWMVSRSTG